MSDVTRDSMAVRAERIVVAARNGAVPPGAAAEQIIDIAQGPLREELAALRGQMIPAEDAEVIRQVGEHLHFVLEPGVHSSECSGCRREYVVTAALSSLREQVRALDEEHGRVVNAARILAGDNERLNESLDGLRERVAALTEENAQLKTVGSLVERRLREDVAEGREQVAALTEQRNRWFEIVTADMLPVLCQAFPEVIYGGNEVDFVNAINQAQKAIRARAEAAEEQVRFLRGEEANARTWCELAGQRHQEIVRLRERVETAERELGAARVNLRAADAVMLAIDNAVKDGWLYTRTTITAAREDYSEPYTYLVPARDTKGVGDG